MGQAVPRAHGAGSCPSEVVALPHATSMAACAMALDPARPTSSPLGCSTSKLSCIRAGSVGKTASALAELLLCLICCTKLRRLRKVRNTMLVVREWLCQYGTRWPRVCAWYGVYGYCRARDLGGHARVAHAGCDAAEYACQEWFRHNHSKSWGTPKHGMRRCRILSRRSFTFD
jgi:hypothetical protein